jgi:hypothetical protein
MEMLDVLTKLREIAQSKPELVKDALENVERTNPKDVNEGALKQAMHDDAEKMSKKEFVEKYGKGSEEFWHSINGYDESINKSTMENKEKEVVKEAIQITTDSPQEAGMMMQILKLAGVQPVDAKMIGAEEPKDEPEADHSDDAMGTMQMAKMRDMMSTPDDEKADETYSNTPDEKTQDTDTLVNFHSGGLNRQKKTYPKVASGDNPMAMEDKITEEELANSLRTQYEGFKQAYQEAAKPDYIDLDKDGNKTEPMKKAAKDAEAKKDK